jgi:DNA-binding XRE family transcriptional regulator
VPCIRGLICGQAAAAGMSSRYIAQGCADWFLMRHVGGMNSTHTPACAAVRDETGHDAEVPNRLPAGPVVSDGTRRADRWTTVADGRKIRQLRHQLGLSQDALADLAQIGVTTLARIERHDQALCRTWTLGRLAAALNAPFESLRPTST